MLQPKSRADRRPRSRRRAPAAAFTLFEVLVATFILLMMGLMFAAVVPVATRGTHQSRSYNQAVLLSQRMIDRLQEKGYGEVSGATLPPDLVDNGGASTGTATVDGQTYAVYPFTEAEQVTQVLGPGATGVIQKRAWGGAGISGTSSLTVVRIVLTWREGGSGRQSQYVVATVLTKMQINN